MLATDGIPSPAEIQAASPSAERRKQGAVAIIECFQEIPCNPCAEACPRGAISIPESISAKPVFDETRCNGCGLCVTRCPGLAIFVVDDSFSPTETLIKLPYEFLPLPQPEQIVDALDRCGKEISVGRVVKVQENGNKTALISLAVPRKLAMDVRNIRCRKEDAV